MSRIVKCVGDACSYVKNAVPELAGQSLALAQKVDLSNPVSTIAQVANEAGHNVYSKQMLEYDLAIVNQTVRQGKAMVQRMKNRKYTPCSLQSLSQALDIVGKRIKEYRDPSAKGRVYRTAWQEYYRAEMGRDLYLLVASINTVLMETQDKTALFLAYQLSGGQKINLMSELKQSCSLPDDATDKAPNCVGKACRALNGSLPDLVGKLIGVASNVTGAASALARGDLVTGATQLASGASGASLNNYNQSVLETDLKILKDALRHGREVVRRLHQRKYRPCSLGKM